MLLLLEETQSYHFIGVGGAGMSAIAYVLLKKGYRVSGSDLHASEATARLSSCGAAIFMGHAAANLYDVGAVVLSSAIRPDNPELIEARLRGLPIYHRADVLAALLNQCDGIAVAGSHGKTTTTSMIAYLLEKAGLDPNVLIGGDLEAIGGNAKVGESSYLVAEADESDGSFLKFTPQIAVVTNIENDHMDHYGNETEIRKAFVQFINQVKPGGFAVLGLDSPAVKMVVAKIKTPYISYALNGDAEYTARNIVTRGTETTFEVWRWGELQGTMSIGVPGRHNVMNCLACVAVGIYLGITFGQIASIMPGFGGAKRRFQTKGKESGIWVVDDYGHHPTEVLTTLHGAKAATTGRVVCVFQPHRFSRTQLLAHEFGTAFSPADVLVLTDIYSAGEDPIEGISGETIVREVQRQTGQLVYYCPDAAALEECILPLLRSGDLLITMGAGNIFQTGERIVERLTKKSLEAINMQRKKIGVVMGGPSAEREVSMNTGNAIVAALREKDYDVVGIDLDPPRFVEQLRENGVEIVFNAIHGLFGEDGRLQGALELLGIPYTGSGVLASAVAMDKGMSKRLFVSTNIPTPRYQLLKRDQGMGPDVLQQVLDEFEPPFVVKPSTQGSTIGLTIVQEAEELAAALEKAFSYDTEVLVEEFIDGTELTVGILGGSSPEALPVIEIVPYSGVYDYHAKYTKGATEYFVPARIDAETARLTKEVAIEAFKILGCSGVARVDVRLDPSNHPYVLEVNTIPGMTGTSLVPKAAAAAGMSFPELCERILLMTSGR
ncbi:MAG TPA: UDP-N-acetylmuramate--L-alanine ligase [Negativicutes bacterium]|nr:UDP-N-acetylmuramate--L-alanine ligase [Negativicutes bacterium]